MPTDDEIIQSVFGTTPNDQEKADEELIKSVFGLGQPEPEVKKEDPSTIADTAKGIATTAVDIPLDLSRAIYTTPTLAGRGSRAIQGWLQDKEIKKPESIVEAALQNPGIVTTPMGVGQYLLEQGGDYIADKLGSAKDQLRELPGGIGEAFQEKDARVATLGAGFKDTNVPDAMGTVFGGPVREAMKLKFGDALDDLSDADIGKAMTSLDDGNWSNLGNAMKDPAAVIPAVMQALPSLYIAMRGGAPAMAGMEATGAAIDAREFEQKTGQKMSDKDFTQAVAQSTILNTLLEKYGVDKVTGKGGGIIKGGARGVVGEGGTETLQQLNSNLAALGYDPNKDLSEGVMESFVGGAGSGGPIGAYNGNANPVVADPNAPAGPRQDPGMGAPIPAPVNGVMPDGRIAPGFNLPEVNLPTVPADASGFVRDLVAASEFDDGKLPGVDVPIGQETAAPKKEEERLTPKQMEEFLDRLRNEGDFSRKELENIKTPISELLQPDIQTGEKLLPSDSRARIDNRKLQKAIVTSNDGYKPVRQTTQPTPEAAIPKEAKKEEPLTPKQMEEYLSRLRNEGTFNRAELENIKTPIAELLQPDVQTGEKLLPSDRRARIDHRKLQKAIVQSNPTYDVAAQQATENKEEAKPETKEQAAEVKAPPLDLETAKTDMRQKAVETLSSNEEVKKLATGKKKNEFKEAVKQTVLDDLTERMNVPNPRENPALVDIYEDAGSFTDYVNNVTDQLYETAKPVKPAKAPKVEAPVAPVAPVQVAEEFDEVDIGMTSLEKAKVKKEKKAKAIAPAQEVAPIAPPVDVPEKETENQKTAREVKFINDAEKTNNRGLGYKKALTSHHDVTLIPTNGQVALANLQKGEKFPLNGKTYEVTGVTDKQLILKDSDGKRVQLNPDHDKFHSFARDVGDRLMGAFHGVDAGDLSKAIERDPSFQAYKALGYPVPKPDPFLKNFTSVQIGGAQPKAEPEKTPIQAPKEKKFTEPKQNGKVINEADIHPSLRQLTKRVVAGGKNTETGSIQNDITKEEFIKTANLANDINDPTKYVDSSKQDFATINNADGSTLEVKKVGDKYVADYTPTKGKDDGTGQIRQDGKELPGKLQTDTIQGTDGKRGTGSVSKGQGEASPQVDRSGNGQDAKEAPRNVDAASAVTRGGLDAAGSVSVGGTGTGSGTDGRVETDTQKRQAQVFRSADDLPTAKKLRANIDAIRTLFALNKEQREPSVHEKTILRYYTGFGGIAEAFPDPVTGKYKPGFEAMGEELKELTGPAYNDIKTSTFSAFYTSPDVVQKVYEAARHLGFDGGRVLEPGSGTGRFLGLVPDDLANKTKFVAVEMDRISGGIAEMLYPKHSVRVEDFSDTKLADNSFDMTIGNVPFADITKTYNNQKLSLHDFFFAKSIDKTKEGGLIGLITSRYTMDKRTTATRQMFAKQVDFIGGIRLPSMAFKGAGTEVVTDLLFFRKREADAPAGGQSWIDTEPYTDGDKSVDINEYFAKNKQMVIGTESLASAQFGRSELRVKIGGEKEMLSRITQAIALLPKDTAPSLAEIVAPKEVIDLTTQDDKIDKISEGSIFVDKNGSVMQKIEGEAVQLSYMGKKVDIKSERGRRVSALIKIKEATREVLRTQNESMPESERNSARANLNTLYDAFLKQYGPINTVNERVSKNGAKTRTQPNLAGFQDDPEWQVAAAIENYDEKNKSSSKAPILLRDVVTPPKPISDVVSAKDGLIVSMNQQGKVDIPYIAKMYGKSEDDVISELGSLIYKDPALDEYVSADEYLTGNVRQKLEIAKAEAEKNPELAKNVDALKAVQPVDLSPGEIDVSLGAPWVPKSDIESFAADLFDTPKMNVTVHHSPNEAKWKVNKEYNAQRSVSANQTYGTSRMNGFDILEDTLNLRIPTIFDEQYDENGKKIRVVNQEKTLEVREKQQIIKEKFSSWIFSDQERAERLVRKYNDEYNNIQVRKFDGSHLTLPGSASAITLNPHQKDAVWRITQAGNTLLAHAVGSGKTFTMIAAAMELRRIGLAKKPLFAVPNHMLAQFSREFMLLYPNAKILVTPKDDLTAKKRKMITARIATGDWDAVIVTHASFNRMDVSQKYQKKFLQEQIDAYEDEIVQAKREKSDSISIKNLEKQKKRLEEKLKNQLSVGDKDTGLVFDELGIDAMFIDEAHEYKNLGFPTKINNVSGINAAGSPRSMGFYMKTRYIEEQTPGHGLVLATGTPISNSMAEMFTMQRYMQHDMLQERNVGHFDAWVASFGEVTDVTQLSPNGRNIEMKTKLAKFKNIPELQQMFRTFSDVQMIEDLNLERPALEGGKPSVHVAPASDALNDYIQVLLERMKAIKSRKVDPKDDNALKVTTDGRKAATDMRMIDHLAEDNPDSKLNQMIDNVYTIWKETAKDKKTQLVFSDLGINGGEERFSVYDDVVKKLIANGIPSHEIAVMGEASDDKKKEVLFDKVRNGDVRVLIGSTGTMGVGTNVQEKLYALHHLDAPWRPSDVEQREGRILRQGNENEEVRIYRYVTERSFDAYMWQILENKARFISQIMKGEAGVRTANDEDSQELSFAEIKALASGNPAVMELAKVDGEIARLGKLEKSHIDEQFRIRKDLQSIPATVDILENNIAALQADIKIRKETKGEAFAMTLGGKNFKERQEAEKTLRDLVRVEASKTQQRRSGGVQNIGKIAGFDLKLSTEVNVKPTLIVQGSGAYKLLVADDMALVTRLENIATSLDNRLLREKDELAVQTKKLSDLKKRDGAKFDHTDKLKTLKVEQKKLQESLKMIDEDKEPAADSLVAATAKEVFAANNAEIFMAEMGDYDGEMLATSAFGEMAAQYLSEVSESSLTDGQKADEAFEILNDGNKLDRFLSNVRDEFEKLKNTSLTRKYSVAQTATPEFKEFFGDSKVVDGNGDPLIVYKGMYPYDWTKENGKDKGPLVESIGRTTEFPAFNGEEKGIKVAGFFGSRETASHFAQSTTTRGAVFPVYLKIDKPWTYDAGGVEFAGNVQFGESGKDFRDAMRSGKYDGAIIKNTKDEGTIYVALKPEQIKSATGNNGKFDKTDPRINHSVMKTVKPELAGKIEEIKKEIAEIAAKINPAIDVVTVDKLFGEGVAAMNSGGTNRRQEVGGMYTASIDRDGKTLFEFIQVSLDLAKFDPRETAYHELWHSLEKFLTKAEQDFLKAQFPGRGGISHDEHIAYAFQKWAMQRHGSNLKPSVKRAFTKIRTFLRQVGEMLRGKGFLHIEDIFTQAFEGKMAKRVPGGELDNEKHKPKEFREFSKKYPSTMEGSHQAARDYLLQKGKETGHEHALLIDEDTGLAIKHHTSGQTHQVTFSDDMQNVIFHPKNNLTLHHNHPNNMPLSDGDIGSLSMRGIKTIIAHELNGTLSAASLTTEMKEFFADNKYKHGESLFNKSKELTLESLYYKAFDGANSVLKDAIIYNKVTWPVANRAHREITLRALANNGIINYTTSHVVDDGDILTEAQEAANNAVSEAIKKLGYRDENGNRTNRYTFTVRPTDGIAKLFGGNGKLAQQKSKGNEVNQEGKADNQGPAVDYAANDVGNALRDPAVTNDPRALGDIIAKYSVEQADPDTLLANAQKWMKNEIRMQKAAPDFETNVDLGYFQKIAINPRTIAQAFKGFAPVWNAAVKQFERRDNMAMEIGKILEPFYNLPRQSKDRVSAVLELGRLNRENFEADEKGIISAQNTTHRDAGLSKLGQKITLTKAESDGYLAARTAMDNALGQFIRVLVKESGFDTTETDPGKLLSLAKDGENEAVIESIDKLVGFHKLMDNSDVDEKALYKAMDKEVAAIAKETDLENAEKIRNIVSLSSQIADIEQARKSGYVPFSRFGNYAIVVKDKDGAVRNRTHMEVDTRPVIGRAKKAYNNREATRITEELRAQYPAEDGYTISAPMLLNTQAALQSAGVDLRSLDTVVLAAGIDPTLYKDEVRKPIEAELQKRGFRKHFIKSKNIPGYSTDFERGIGDYVMSISSYLARREVMPELVEATGNIDPVKQKNLREYTDEYVKYIQNPSEEMHRWKAFMFHMNLAGNIGSAAVNALQTPMVTAPYLTAFTDEKTIVKELTQAYKDVMKMIQIKDGLPTINPALAPLDVREDLVQADADGYLVPAQTLDQMGVATSSRSKLLRDRKKIDKALKVATNAYSSTERINRMVTYIATHRIGSKDFMAQTVDEVLVKDELWNSQEKEYTPDLFAKYVIDETHFKMGKMNRSKMTRGAGGVVFQFKSFSFLLTQVLYRMAKHMGKKGKKAFMISIIALWSCAGLLGLPFADDLKMIYENLWKMTFDERIDVDRSMQEFFNNMTGSDRLGELIMHGPARLSGIDIAGRVGMGNIIPGIKTMARTLGDEKIEPKDLVSDILGVSGGRAFGDTYKMFEALKDDRPWYEVAAQSPITPAAIRNPLLAQSWAEKGVPMRNKTKIHEDLITPVDVALKTIGLTPSSVARTREIKNMAANVGTAVTDKQARFYKKLTDAVTNGDSEKIASVIKDIEEYNEGKELFEQVIINKGTLKQKARAAMAGADGDNVPKKARGKVQELNRMLPEEYRNFTKGVKEGDMEAVREGIENGATRDDIHNAVKDARIPELERIIMKEPSKRAIEAYKGALNE